MGLFSRSSGSSSIPWIKVESLAQLDEILSAPSDKAKLFFKHSTRCGISSFALKSFEKEWYDADDSFELYFVDLIAHRDVSNAIAEKLDVTHQSPQAIVIRQGEVIYDASHSSIDAAKIQKLT